MQCAPVSEYLTEKMPLPKRKLGKVQVPFLMLAMFIVTNKQQAASE
jgi:hypothetical protein